MNTKELTLVKKAIMNEIEGYEFYKMAAKSAANQETADTLMVLAKEEENHVEWLKALLGKLENEDLAFDLAALPAPPSPEIFRWEKVDQEDPNRALSVFSIGMQMEKASAEFYEKGRDQSENQDLKKLFDILAKWEWAHYGQFHDEYEKLQQEFWSEQSYAPF